MMRNISVKKLVTAALFAALICVFTMSIRIPTPGTGGYIHPGDAAVILSGIFLDPVAAFLAAGIGSCMADFLGGYFIYVPITFVVKGLVAVVTSVVYCHGVSKGKSGKLAVLYGGITDILLVTGGYFLCESLLYGPAAAFLSLPANGIQGISGLVIAGVLYPGLERTAVFGSFVVDLMARSPRLPVPGETVKGSVFKMGPGGKGFNQGVAAHKAGADVTMISKVGRDSFGEVAFNTMRELQMDTSHMFVTDDTETGCALILVDEKTSQNEIIIVPGACSTITEEEVKNIEAVLKEAEYVLLQLEVNQEANELVAELACKHGCKVIVNTAPYAPVTDEFLSKAYMVTPNEVEAEEITGVPVKDLESAKKAAAYFYDRGVKEVLITLGSRGVFVSSGGREEIIPCFKVEAVDTTGAGDAFNGGLLKAGIYGRQSVLQVVLLHYPYRRWGQHFLCLYGKKLTAF